MFEHLLMACVEGHELDVPGDWAWGFIAACIAIGGLAVVYLPRVLPSGADAD